MLDANVGEVVALDHQAAEQRELRFLLRTVQEPPKPLPEVVLIPNIRHSVTMLCSPLRPGRCAQHQMGPNVMGGAGFGCYGSLGKHFGKTRFESAGNEYEVDAAVIEGLDRDLVQKAVEDSLKVLMFAEVELTTRT